MRRIGSCVSKQANLLQPARVVIVLTAPPANREKPRMATAFSISEMQPEDYEEVYALWQQSEHIGLTPSDSQPAVHAFLARNPALSLVARQGPHIIGAVLCGHDGRRGYLYHLAIAREHRKQGIGRAIVEACLTRLASVGILKATLFVYRANESAQQFWRRLGCKDRTDLVVLQKETVPATTS